MNRVYRELRLKLAEYSVRFWIARVGNIVRQDTTEYRGPLCIAGQGHAWAVCELIECKPSTHPNVTGYVWSFGNLRILDEPIPTTTRSEYSLWQSPRGPEPPMSSAYLQHQLNELFTVESEVLCNVLSATAPAAMEPVQPIVYEPVAAVAVSEAGQLAMF